MAIQKPRYRQNGIWNTAALGYPEHEFERDNRIDSDAESWKEFRERRLEIDGYQCSNCGSTESLQVHHVVPESLGGVDEVSNLRTLCADCHDKAHGSAIGLIANEQTSTETRWLPTIDTMAREQRKSPARPAHSDDSGENRNRRQ